VRGPPLGDGPTYAVSDGVVLTAYVGTSPKGGPEPARPPSKSAPDNYTILLASNNFLT